MDLYNNEQGRLAAGALKGCRAVRQQVVAVRIVGLLALLLLTGCGFGYGLDVEQENQELNDKLYEFIKNGPEETRPFTEFTSWEWDTVKVVHLEALDDTDEKSHSSFAGMEACLTHVGIAN